MKEHVIHEIMSIPIHAVTMKEAVAYAETLVDEEKANIIATANAEMIMLAQKDDELKDILQHADMVVPDGAGVLWAGRELNKIFPERVTGADYAEELLKTAKEKNWRVYFLGGNAGVAEKAVENMKKKYGDFEVAGIHNGYFDEKEETKIIEDIRKNKTKLLLCAMGVPKQEKWLWAHREELGNVIAIGIGGVFDVMAGHLKRAPLWMRNHSLEWAYRLYLQPSRCMRMISIPRFMWAVKKEKREKGL